jgi:hypothetical protein
MTTTAAANLYLAQHLVEWEGKGYAVYNPENKPLEELPVIYGFNNGGSRDWLEGVLISEDGHVLGGHTCSAEGYMPHDLGILEGSRPDRHETFKEHHPQGYRMDFVPYIEAKGHAGLDAAFKMHAILNPSKEQAE